MTNQEKFIGIFGLDTWKQIIVSTNVADKFKDFWTSPYKDQQNSNDTDIPKPNPIGMIGTCIAIGNMLR